MHTKSAVGTKNMLLFWGWMAPNFIPMKKVLASKQLRSMRKHDFLSEELKVKAHQKRETHVWHIHSVYMAVYGTFVQIGKHKEDKKR